MPHPRIVLAANRPIGLACLRLLLAADIRPSGLVVAEGKNAACAEDMRALLPGVQVLSGTSFREPEGVTILTSLKPDYILSIHFPYIVPRQVLSIPTIGALNLHPAYLPYNRGWHTPTWAIVEGPPYGAPLHWMDEGIDTGDIALQRQIAVLPTDTAHSLYQRALKAEAEIMREAIPLLKAGPLPRIPQREAGTVHNKTDLQSLRRLDRKTMTAEELETRIRALTTNNPEEAAYFEEHGEEKRVRAEGQPDTL